MPEPRPPFRLTPSLRQLFKENVGELLTDEDIPGLCQELMGSGDVVIAVGDTTTLNLIQNGLVPDLAIIDLGTRRGPLGNEERSRMEVILSEADVTVIDNPPEMITRALWNYIKDFHEALRRGEDASLDHENHGPSHNKFKISRPVRKGTPSMLRIIGEEDLASLPCIYFSLEREHVLYGLPDRGLMHIQVNDIHRTIVYDALKKMEACNGPQHNQPDRESTA